MGNLCGKQSSSDPFEQPGRTLGSAPPKSSNTRAPIPATVTSQGRTLGGSGSGGGGGGGGGGAARNHGTMASNDPRSAAAKAAEARAASSSRPKGKLGRELARDKSRTMTDQLGVASENERRRRETDQVNEARNYN